MDQETVTRTILTNIIDQYLRAIADDPDRSIRKLVDMAERVSDGHFQKIFYQMMQKMAEDVDSPYYKLISELVRRVDPLTIKKVGINIGFNAWTLGARNIRKIEKETDHFIPWTIMFTRNGSSDSLPFAEVERLIAEARRSELYAFFFRYTQMPPEWEACLDLFRKHDDCAFTLMLPSSAVTEPILDELSSVHNLLILIDTGEADWQETIGKLAERHCLFGVYRTYDQADQVSEIVSGDWMEEVLQAEPIFAFALAGDNCSEEDAQKVATYIRRIRVEQDYPIMPVDVISDFLVISNIISHDDHCLSICPDGTICTGKGHILNRSDVNAKGLPFSEIITKVF